LPDGCPRREQWADSRGQLRTIRDQLLGPHGEDIERAAADEETEVLEQAADLVLKIAFYLDQQRPARQPSP
jgi:hypothetical protein